MSLHVYIRHVISFLLILNCFVMKQSPTDGIYTLWAETLHKLYPCLTLLDTLFFHSILHKPFFVVLRATN